jgi:DNA-binding CsgD family transcriptional regulator
VPESSGRASAQLIGRTAELARIDTFLGHAKTGNGQLLTLVGPAGVGKSRLVSEALHRARVRGFRVLHGTASPHQEDLSYAPLVEALRPVVNEGRQPSDRHLLDGLVDLSRLFPDLPIGPPDPLVDAGLERTRLSEAVWRLLTRASRERPVLVVIEDLHCADGGTISTLGYLARGLEGFPLLLLAASRPVQNSNSAAVQFLRSTPNSTHFEIPPLGAADIALLLEQRLGGPARDDLISLIETRTRGVPLFVLGLLTMLVDSGRLRRVGGLWVPLPGAESGVPAGAAGFFAAQLSALSAEDRRLIQAIAVCGDAATVDVLQQVSSVPDAEARLSDLRLRGVVVEHVLDGDVLYATDHPLFAEVAYDQLLESARRAMHAKAARLVQQRWPGEVSRVAAHVARAGSEIVPDEALAVLSAATSVALQKLAGVEAMRHAEAAISIATRSARRDLLARLHEQLAEAAALTGLPERSIDSYLEAARLTTTPLDQARLFRKTALVAWQLGRFDAAYSHLDGAERALGDIDAVDERIFIAEQRLYLAYRTTKMTELESAVAQLRELAAVHPLQPHNRASVMLAPLPLQFSDADMLRTYETGFSDDAVDRVTEMGEPLLLAHIHRPWIIAALVRGDIATARRRALVARTHTHQLGPVSNEVSPILLGGWAEFLGGEWSRALQMADEARAIADRISVPRDRAGALALRAMILLHRGNIHETRRDLAEARAIFGHRDRHISGTLDIVDTLLCINTRNVGRAVELAAGLNLLSTGHIPLIGQQVRGEAFLAAGDLFRAREVVAFLHAGSVSRHVRAQAARLEGMIVAAEGDHGVAAEYLLAACEELTSMGLPYDAARAGLDLAELTFHPKPAEQALTVFDRLEAKPLADRARQLLRRLGQSATARARISDGVLSGREHEVARLVAQGLSNATIAERLFISPRTVTTHLDRIYRRLRLSNRAALTRYVMEQSSGTAAD